MFEVGRKVRCIKESGWKTHKMSPDLEDRIFENPVLGEVYTITRVRSLEENDPRIKELGLEDTAVFWLDGMGEQCFTTRRFELVEE